MTIAKEKKLELGAYICPECGYDHTVRHGYNVTKQGKFARRKCLKCGSTFYENKAGRKS